MLRHFDIGHIERTVSMYWRLNTDLARSEFNAKLSFYAFGGRFKGAAEVALGMDIPSQPEQLISRYLKNILQESCSLLFRRWQDHMGFVCRD